MTAQSSVSTHHTRLVALSLAVFLLLAIVHTWPLAAAPAHWSRVDGGDGALNIWAVAWVGHHLPRQPWRVADANIFYPERLTLAYSEMMWLQGAIAAPVLALGGSAVLAYNVTAIAGFALTGFAFCLLMWRWTGSWSAGYVAGSLAAFNAHTLVRMAHMQALHPEFFALILFALDRLVVERRFRDAWWLAVGFALQGLTSIYLLVFSVWLLLFAGLSRVGEWMRAGAAAMVVRLASAAGLAVVLLLPYLWPYLKVRAMTGFGRAADEQAGAQLVNYLSTGSRLHFDWWSKAFASGSTSFAFPGVVATALVLTALCCQEQRRDPRFRMCAIGALGCLAVSFAPLLPFYPFLHERIVLFQAVRVVAHIGQVVLLMMAVLAGFGVAGLQRRLTTTGRRAALAVVLVTLVNLEALRAPIGFTWFPGISSAYDVLAGEPHAVIAEMPFPLPQQWFLNGPYMVNSTRHWQPLLNGYSGFRPGSYQESYDALRGFPSDASLVGLHSRGATHVVVHRQLFISAFGAARFNAIAGVHSLQPVAHDDDVFIYRLSSR
jgi:hypothetical protein